MPMSHNPTSTYRNIQATVSDSDSDHPDTPSPQPISSPLSPTTSSLDLSSDPSAINNPPVTILNTTLSNLDLALPSTAVEFNFPHIKTKPTTSSKLNWEDPTITSLPPTAKSVFTPPNSQPHFNRIMAPTSTH